MLRRLVLIAMLLAVHSDIAADSPSPTMTKIVTRVITPRMDPDSFDAKPKTYYLAGDKFARVEFEPDPAHNMHQLVIINEPNMWIVNLVDRTASHEVDKGPTFVAHCTIFPTSWPKELSSLEFGREVEFFKAHKAATMPDKNVDGRSCNALEYQFSAFHLGDFRLVLYTAADTGLPVELEIYRDTRLRATIRYDKYERDIPFAPEVFTPPANLKLVEPAK